MKKWFSVGDEFYVGYLPEAPKSIASVIQKVIFTLIFLMIGAAFLTALEQKKFSASKFEYGVYSEIEGYIFNKPVPHLLIPLGKDLQKNDLNQIVLLVGFGKMGADKFLRDVTNAKAISNGSKVRLSGSLIYGDGKVLLQVDERTNLKLLEATPLSISNTTDKKEISLSGEIVDPKCYFGVMKPGEGKTHRSCAIRCIAGGIPPVLKTDSLGYFLLLNEKSEPVSSEIVNIVGDHISLTGVAVHWNDWTILQVSSEEIRQLSAEKKRKENLISFEAGMAQCN